VGKHLLAALLAEGIEALAAQLLQLIAFGVVVDLGHVFAQDPPGHVLRGGGAGCCLANQRPSSSGSISDWSMGLMRIRSAMNARRRRKAAEGLVAME
jgi:hypothetical protein